MKNPEYSLCRSGAFLLIGLLVAVSSLIASCSDEPDLPPAVAIQDVAINGYDPVSYFSGTGPVPGSDKYESGWKGIKYYFSTPENLELFKMNPSSYAPRYNGYCAFALSRGDYVTGNPDAYAIVDGKLYLLFDLDIRSAWLQDKDNYITMADRNWQNSEFNHQ